MKVSELSAILGRLEALCVAAGAKGIAKELQAFSDTLRPQSEITVEAFCSRVRDGLSQDYEARGRRKSSSGGRAPTLNSDAIGRHVLQLRNSGTDRLAFEVAFDELQSDKTIKPADVAEIARRYADSVTKYKTVKAAHADISKAFIRQARFENKLI